LALTSLTSGGRSVSIVRSRTQATELLFITFVRGSCCTVSHNPGTSWVIIGWNVSLKACCQIPPSRLPSNSRYTDGRTTRYQSHSPSDSLLKKATVVQVVEILDPPSHFLKCPAEVPNSSVILQFIWTV
jgi:hypothetical protein